MRQRKAKDLDRRLKACAEYMETDPSPDTWDSCFAGGNGGGLFLEIGCGKGQFIIKKAVDDPSSRFIAAEGQETVILRALEKAAAVSPSNLKFLCAYVNDMGELFRENQLSGIYLNFSDPWPKARHIKRRLTWRGRLEQYARALKPGGFVQVKTDNDPAFEFALNEIDALNGAKTDGGPCLRVVEMTRDLHGSDLASADAMSEYEEKFSGAGKNINYIRFLVEKRE